nr:MAG TPA: hypothetical protein [Caudoviricetes sp.]
MFLAWIGFRILDVLLEISSSTSPINIIKKK